MWVVYTPKKNCTYYLGEPGHSNRKRGTEAPYSVDSINKFWTIKLKTTSGIWKVVKKTKVLFSTYKNTFYSIDCLRVLVDVYIVWPI